MDAKLFRQVLVHSDWLVYIIVLTGTVSNPQATKSQLLKLPKTYYLHNT